MTEFKKGDRVRVEFEGVIEDHALGSGRIAVKHSDRSYANVYAQHVALIAKPLEIGDVLTPDSDTPEPPVCTIVTDIDDRAWQKHADESHRWFSGGNMPKNGIRELARTRGPLTVRYVP